MIRFESSKWLYFPALLGAILLAGCGSEPDEMPTPAGGPVVDIASKSGDFSAPKDSMPDSNAETIYFVANSPGGPGLFRVPGNGGEATPVAVGGVFVDPIGVAIGSDDQQAYIADTKAGGSGEILVVNLATGDVAVLAGTEGTAPAALDVVPGASGDTVYYAGVTAMNQEPVIFSISASGGAATVEASGAPLVHPFGIAVAGDGTLYVADDRAADPTTGKVFRISAGAVTPIVDSVVTGKPAGIALTTDDSTLLVSSIDEKTAKDQVLIVKIPAYDTAIFNSVIGENEAGGGVHRARGVNILAWADLSAGSGGSGLVYRIKL